MNFKTQLSIKSALHFALLCLVSCLLFTACSIEGSELNPDDLDPTTPGTIRFSASAPLASEAVTTRIGIDNDSKPTVENYTQDEPVIWIEGDAIAVYFVKQGGGSPIQVKFEVEEVKDGGTSAELKNAEPMPNLTNGDYDLYAITPYIAGAALDNITLYLSNQVQAGNGEADNYSHLGKTSAMRAVATDISFASGQPTSPVNFSFSHITSFLRFHITNGTEDNITVTSITLTHTNIPYSQKYNGLTDALSSPQADASSFNLSFGSEGILLSAKAHINAYMSSFPIASVGSGSVVLSVEYLDEQSQLKEPITYNISHSMIEGASVNLLPAGGRMLFDVALNPNTGSITFGTDPYEKDSKYYITSDDIEYEVYLYDGKYFTPGSYLPPFLDAMFANQNYYIYARDLSEDICPDGWALMTTYSSVFEIPRTITYANALLDYIDYPFLLAESSYVSMAIDFRYVLQSLSPVSGFLRFNPVGGPFLGNSYGTARQDELYPFRCFRDAM